MTEYFCKCLNVRLLADDFPSPEPFLSRNNLLEEEKIHEFFKQLPLIMTRIAQVREEQPSLVDSETVGSWIVYKCINCQTYLSATCKLNEITLMNGLLSKIGVEELENIMASCDYSPVYRILIMDYTTPLRDDFVPSHLGEHRADQILDLKRQLLEYIDKKKKYTEELIKKFADEQRSTLNESITRASNDFLLLKNTLSSRENGYTLNCQLHSNESACCISAYEKNRVLEADGSLDVDDKTIASQIHDSERNWDDTCSTDIPPSLDSEGLFPLDGMEQNAIIDDDDHSEEDLSDTDGNDSGSRDEGIHIPRRKSLNFARSLPIRVPSDFDPALRLFDDRYEDAKTKHNYQQKRSENPVDIAASIKALANSVHGDTIFGDLPRRKAGFRI